MSEETSNFEKFKDLLKEIFRFDVSDLDFGIYRILNGKRSMIDDFIDNRISQIVEETFAQYTKDIASDIEEKLKAKAVEVKTKIAQDAIDNQGNVNPKYDNELRLEVIEEYKELKKQKEELAKIEDIESQVYNDLYTFFSRYYVNGDFIPQYRYSINGHKYAIPYNGEEVKLYWANYDEYYVKTGELFKDYSFKVSTLADTYTCKFNVIEAKGELGSNKATKQRFFVLDDEDPLELKDKTLSINFQYRELSENEANDYNAKGGSNTKKQENINQHTYKKIVSLMDNTALELALEESSSNNPAKSVLLYHLDRFTSKNTSDYFIHKNLKRFLTDQLDYFIKSEILDIGTLKDIDNVNKQVARSNVVKQIGNDIIDFLSQIEDFQKKLWEKKKFVLKTEYVITMDRIPSSFYHEILNSKEQVEEWKTLGFPIPDDENKLSESKLPIDTKYFSTDFKYRLLEELSKESDIDDLLDGLLIKSENWQALNLLEKKYGEKVQTIYIDPPYNTGNDGFMYRDNFQHSSWLSMMQNRLMKAKSFLSFDGVIFTSVDDNELSNLSYLMNDTFNKIEVIKVKMREPSRQLTQKAIFQKSIEYCLCYSNSNAPAIRLKQSAYSFKEYELKIIETDKPVAKYQVGKYLVEEFLPSQYRIEKCSDITDPYVVKPISIRGKIKTAQFTGKFYEENLRNKFQKEHSYNHLYKVYGLGDDGFGFRYIKNPDPHTLNATYYQGIPLRVRQSMNNAYKLLSYHDYYDFAKEMNNESKNIKKLGLDSITSAKPVNYIRFLLSMTSIFRGSYVLDFFAGSGTTAHAVMKLNKEDGGKRKFILVEMADYFYTVIIPRLKKVAYSFNWQDGKPNDTDGLGIFLKYQSLEQYEDTLDSIEFKQSAPEGLFDQDEYLIKYFLDFETKDSPCLVSIDNMKDPFSYKIKANLSEVGKPENTPVDILETFAYLLGIKEKKIKQRKEAVKRDSEEATTYLFLLGENGSEKYAVVLRQYDESWKEDEFNKDNEIIKREINTGAQMLFSLMDKQRFHQMRMACSSE